MKKMFLTILFIAYSFTTFAEEYYIATEELPPYNYTENGKITGISTDIVKAVFKEAKINAIIVSYPWARAYNTALDNKKYFIYSIVKTETRKKLFRWVGKVAPTKSYLYKLKNNKMVKIKNILDANNYKVGAVRNDVGHQYLIKYGIEKITLASDNLNLLKMLLHKRVEIIEFDEATFKYLTKQNGIQADQFSKVFYNKEISGEQYLACNVQVPIKIIKKLKKAFKKINKSGKYKAILKKWGIN